jgi:hypothetical protein
MKLDQQERPMQDPGIWDVRPQTGTVTPDADGKLTFHKADGE